MLRLGDRAGLLLSRSSALLGRLRAASSSIDTAAKREAEVLRALEQVVEPATGADVVSLGAVQALSVTDSAVQFSLDLLVNGHPDAAKIRQECEDAVRKLPWSPSVSVSIPVRRPVSSFAPEGSGLHNVDNVIAVASCKGGVGKSTVAVNLALSLAKTGARVALLDTDVYGPSLPALIHPPDVTVRKGNTNPKFVQPIDYEGVKCMSFGYVNPKAGPPGAGGQQAAVIRGPIVSRVVNQLTTATEWGDIDFLVLDMPPGTGDIQITLAQSLAISGAVVVTTPQKLSYIDVIKGIAMFKEMKVPTLSVVENMAYFDGDDGKRYYPFGRGAGAEVCAQHGIASMFTLPLSPAIAQGNDTQTPVVLSMPESEEAKVYAELAADTIRQVVKLKYSAHLLPSISYSPKRGVVLRYFTSTGAEEYVVDTQELLTRDPKTGAKIRDVSASDRDVRPVKFDVKGLYGVSVVWSDGRYADIYSFDMLRKLARGKL